MEENEARGAEAANQDGADAVYDAAAGTGRFMSKPEAVKRLLDLMKRKSMTPEDVEALTMGMRNLVRRHAQRQKNRARRRAESTPGGAGESGQGEEA